jgi:hypothetical protein
MRRIIPTFESFLDRKIQEAYKSSKTILGKPIARHKGARMLGFG